VRLVLPDTHHISIVENTMAAADVGVTINSGSHDNVISKNEITMNHYGFDDTGAWETSKVRSYVDNLRQAFYQWRHHWIFNGGGLVGVGVGDGGDNNLVCQNYIHHGFNGMNASTTDNVVTRNLKSTGNKITNLSSVGIVVYSGLMDFEISENFLKDNNIHLRMHHLSDPNPRRLYIYNNRMINPPNHGKHIWFHWLKDQPKPALPPEAYIYHNSMSGGNAGLATDAYGYQYDLIPKFFILI
jgi:hypothetical protein